MKLKRNLLLVASAFLFSLWSSNTLAANFINLAVPNNLGSVEGNSYDSLPFLDGGNTVRYQEVFSASQFSAISTSGGILTGMLMRLNSPNGNFGYITTVTNLEINLSTTLKSPDGLSTVFSQNIGADATTVLRPGPLTLDYIGGSGNPNNFGGPIPFATPFYYNPNAGNLLLDVKNFSGGDLFQVYDAQDTVGDSVSRVSAVGNLPTSGVYATSGTADSLGLVVEFQVMVVPEPSPAILMLGGVGLLSGWCFLSKVRKGARR